MAEGASEHPRSEREISAEAETIPAPAAASSPPPPSIPRLRHVLASFAETLAPPAETEDVATNVEEVRSTPPVSGLASTPGSGEVEPDVPVRPAARSA
jgi:hypothetical protein